jgi:hypothetical protein
MPARKRRAAAKKKEGFWAQGRPRRYFITTIIWDSGVILVAMGMRALIVTAHHWIPEAAAADRGIKALEWIADTGVVGIAITFALFDLLKLVVREWKEVVSEARGHGTAEGDQT